MPTQQAVGVWECRLGEERAVTGKSGRSEWTQRRLEVGEGWLCRSFGGHSAEALTQHAQHVLGSAIMPGVWREMSKGK